MEPTLCARHQAGYRARGGELDRCGTPLKGACSLKEDIDIKQSQGIQLPWGYVAQRE